MSTNQTTESSQSHSPVDRFTYIAEIPSLQEIASCKVALAIRYNSYSRRFLFPHNFTDLDFHDREFHEYDSKVESLKTPSVIKETIKNSVEKIENELRSWLHHFNHILFRSSRWPYKVFEVDINWCVWLPNGEIDYLKTGMKMLKSEKLSEIQKFLIMCEYCMEDEIRKVSSDILSLDYIANTKYHDDGILFYWINFLKDTLHKVPLDDYASPEAAMAKNSRRNARFAIEYFWHRIGAEDQLAMVSMWVSTRCLNHFDCAVVERLISAMSLDQQQRLLAQRSSKMLINFSLYSRSTRCALWTWEYCKEVILDEQFADIIEIILKRCIYKNHPCPALNEIWETAYDHQRKFVMETMVNVIIYAGLFTKSEYTSEFVIRFLQRMSVEHRKKTIFDQAENIKHYFLDLFSLNEILNVCLPQPDDKLEFIKSVIDSDGMKKSFLKLLHATEFKKVDALLEDYFGSDIEGARAFKLKLLKSMFEESSGNYFIYDINEWKKLAAYIDEIFSNDQFQASKEKYRLIKLAIHSYQFRYLFHHRYDIQEMIKIFQLMFANQELQNIKRVLSCSFGESLKSRSYWKNAEFWDETYFLRIVNWCLGNDEEAILRFKKQVPQDIILDRFFHIINVWYCGGRINADYLKLLLDGLNKYLKWYLASDDQVKMFKLSTLSASFNNLKIFRSILNKKEDQILEVLLKWFFGSDDEQMQKFRSENFLF